jgi:UDP-N-acetylglucosamine 2-epimerase (non-hydrolysing)
MIEAGDRFHPLQAAGVTLLEPLGYIDFLALEAASAGVLTDSGGIQEESTVLGVPCLTLRDETERPITVTQGTNHIVGQDLRAVLEVIEKIVSAPLPQRRRPRLWDGRSAERVVGILEQRYG